MIRTLATNKFTTKKFATKKLIASLLAGLALAATIAPADALASTATRNPKPQIQQRDEAKTVGTTSKPPTARQAARARWAKDARPPIRTHRAANARTGKLLGAWEPVYAITSADYVSTVDAAIGRLVMWDLVNGQWTRTSSCSATSVGNNLVLTAAHCLSTRWDAYSFLPGLVGDSAPSGEWFAAADRAWAHGEYFQLAAQNQPAQIAVDYAFIKFDPQHNQGLNLSDAVGGFEIAMDVGAFGRSVVTVGYPAEGFYSSVNGGRCNPNAITCQPYQCESTAQGTADFGGGWKAVGIGCDANGGISGSAMFSQIDGTWKIVSVFDQGGWMIDTNGAICTDRSRCNWYMANAWGPEFRTGWLDGLYQFAATA